MTWPNLPALELLVALSERGSIAAAAAACGIAQPNATRTLARLEKELGRSLVVRSTKGSSLTPEGLLVVEWSRPVLAAAKTWYQEVSSLAAGGVETMKIAASQTVAEHLLPRWLAKWQSISPGTRVAITVGNSAEVVRSLLSGSCTLGFIEGPEAPQGLNSEIVGEDELVLVVPPRHPWARRRCPLQISELVKTPLVTREMGSGTRLTLEQALAPLTTATPLLELASNAAIRVSAMAGVAPAVLSRLAVSDDLSARQLIEIPVLELNLRRQLRALWVGPRRLQGKSGEFLTLVRRKL